MVEHNQSANNPTNGGYNNAYKFNGKELDDATGMYYYGARYYDPRISIFVSVGPLAEQTMEPYLYTGNNPIMFTDPTGMEAEGIDDVRFRDRKGNLIATYQTKEVDKDITLSGVDIGRDLNINLNKIESTAKSILPDVDVVGFGVSAEAVAGVGAEESIDVFYHLDGQDKGKTSVHFTGSFKVGTLSAGGSVYATSGDYVDKKVGDKKGFSSDVLNGRSYTVGGGVSVGGVLGVTGSYTYTTDTGGLFGETNYRQVSVGISAGLPTSLPVSVSGSVNETKSIWKSK